MDKAVHLFVKVFVSKLVQRIIALFVQLLLGTSWVFLLMMLEKSHSYKFRSN